MGWRDILEPGEPRKYLKYGKDDSTIGGDLSGFSDISGELAERDTPEQAAARALYAEAVALFNRIADADQWDEQERAEELEKASSDPAARLALLRDYFEPFGAPEASGRAEVRAERTDALQRDPVAITAHVQQEDTEQRALECGRCRHIDMREALNHKGRRQFQWTCTKSHRILRGGVGLEDVLLAPPTCKHHDDRPLDGPGVFSSRPKR